MVLPSLKPAFQFQQWVTHTARGWDYIGLAVILSRVVYSQSQHGADTWASARRTLHPTLCFNAAQIFREKGKYTAHPLFCMAGRAIYPSQSIYSNTARPADFGTRSKPLTLAAIIRRALLRPRQTWKSISRSASDRGYGRLDGASGVTVRNESVDVTIHIARHDLGRSNSLFNVSRRHSIGQTVYLEHMELHGLYIYFFT
jgi:hypothetical protein